MIRIYQAANLPSAHLLQDHLAQHSIETRLFNVNLQSVMGEAPVNEVGPELWLLNEEDLERARDLVAKYEARMQKEVEDVRCAHCGAINPGSFELCWQCGKALI